MDPCLADWQLIVFARQELCWRPNTISDRYPDRYPDGYPDGYLDGYRDSHLGCDHGDGRSSS